MMPQADQLDIQCEQAARTIRKNFGLASAAVQHWTPAPCPPPRPRGRRR